VSHDDVRTAIHLLPLTFDGQEVRCEENLTVSCGNLPPAFEGPESNCRRQIFDRRVAQNFAREFFNKIGRQETFSRMVNWRATLVKLPAEIDQLGWRSLVDRLAIRSQLQQLLRLQVTK
jgi:hypothetical protein